MIPPRYRILQTEHAGRCLVANETLAKGTIILQTDAPVLSVIMREYRREVCAHCFHYDRGRNLPVRDAETGKAFCSAQHGRAWAADVGDDARKCWALLEEYVKRKAGREVEMADVDAPRPTVQEVDAAWEGVEGLAASVREAREGMARVERDSWSKRHRRVVHEALEVGDRVVDPDVLSLLLTGVLLRARSSSMASTTSTTAISTTEPSGTTITNGSTTDRNIPDTPYEQLLTLAPTATPYTFPQNLTSHVHAYIILLSLLPTPLLPYITPQTCRSIPRHEVHNSFGLRSLDDGGDEFLGYGVWPGASLFNHSCEPNVGKARGSGGPFHAQAGNGSRNESLDGDGHGGGEADGRTWTFWTTMDVREGGELAISYLGGEEDTLDVRERRRRLKSTWEFECRCSKCVREAA